jgi:hypothetical protein
VTFVAAVLISACCAIAEDAPKPAKPAATTAAAKKPKDEKPPENKPQKWAEMQYGSLLSATYENRQKSGDFTHKGIEITVGTSPWARVIFDTELLRYSAAWRDGFINFTNVGFDGAHGPMPSPNGKIIWASRGQEAGVSLSEEFKDPRQVPYGPLPADTWGHYKGLYRDGKQVVFNYSVGDCDILDLPGSELVDGNLVFTRTMEIGPSEKKISLVIAPKPKAPATQPSDDPALGWLMRGDVQGIESKQDDTKNWITIAPHKDVQKITVFVFPFVEGMERKLARHAIDLRAMCKGGASNWPDTVTTKGSIGKGDGPYVVDTITVPEENPYKSWMRIGGLDFFSDGRAAVCTWSGDVWIVSGINQKLDKVVWKRYAAGLFQTLGLKIVKDEVYVLGRDQITRLHDLNGDGEADWYENFNNDVMAAESFHEFNFDLQTDSKGNFYFAKAGAVNPGGRGWQRTTPHNGTVLKISPDGKKFEVYATGVRAPNGMSAGPHDELTVSDNQGTWTPVCRISFVNKGTFLGVQDLAHFEPKPMNYGDPICWFPYPDIDNSSGGGVWVTTDKWGPFRDRMLHMSYGQCSLFLVMVDQVGDVVQGGVVKFPNLEFESGICRARVNPIDNQIYVVGLKGWQTRAAKDACFQRVRYTGKTVNMPTSFHVKENGIELGFTNPVDPETAGDPDSYDVEQWNYLWTHDYGSPEVHVDNPDEKGRQPVKVAAAKVSVDKRTVLLVIPDIQPVMQMKIAMKIESADHADMEYDLYSTLNKVPNWKPKPKPASQPTTVPSTRPVASVK